MTRHRLSSVLLAMLLVLVPLSVAAQEHAAPAAPQGAEQGEHAAPAAQGEHAPDEHAAAGEHESAEHAGPSWGEYAFKWANFFLLAALLYWLLVVPPTFVRENFEFDGLRPILARRAAAILDARRLAGEQRADARRRTETSAQRLAHVDEEAAKLVVTAKQDAERERQRLAAAAEVEAARIREHARSDMQGEVVRAQRELRVHTADAAVAMAREILQENFSEDDQQRLIREYLERLGTSVA